MTLSKNKERAITLIALVISIIVLLILAGVTITALSGENGLLKRAAEAKEQTDATQKAEQAKIDATAALIEMQTSGDICNKPNLKTGMIPVKWNGTTWVKADANNTNKDWYNYSQSARQWANVVTVKENGTDIEKNANSKTRAEYISAPVGTEIQMDDITTMFVWILRYAYKIESTETIGYHKSEAGEISIEWLLGATNQPVNNVEIVEYNKTTTQNYTKFPDGYVVHPAFTANTEMGGTGDEITGFWVGKFESSNYQMAENYKNNVGITQDSSTTLTYGQGDGTNVTIKPNVTAWRAINTTSIFNVCQNMTKASNIHGLSSEDTTTVMMQNSQSGAVAYLAQSDYGNKQTSEATSGIWNNPYTEGITYIDNNNSRGIYSRFTTLTGMAGWERNASTIYYATVKDGTKQIKDDGSITITFIPKKEDGTNGTEFTNTYYSYYTANGVHASTTNNVYGIYDMAGGAWEYMANYLKNVEKTTDGYKYDFVNNFNALSPKYVTGYSGIGDVDHIENNYTSNKAMYGDAVWETSNGAIALYSWNDDYSGFPYLLYPFFGRGGYFNDGSSAGEFYFGGSNGGGVVATVFVRSHFDLSLFRAALFGINWGNEIWIRDKKNSPNPLHFPKKRSIIPI